jgi:aminoglycoside phosphotransferase (APT) family kinase protein
MADIDALSRALAPIVARRLGPPGEIRHLARLTGGATRATWSFDAVVGAEALPLILQQSGARMLPAADPMSRLPKVYGALEAALLEAAGERGVPRARVRLVLTPEEGLGDAVICDRVEGESLGARINRDERFAGARETMAAQCGRILAAIHAIPPAAVPALIDHGPAAQVGIYREIFESFDHPLPALELGLRWAAERAGASAASTVVHGDFRNGNLIVGPDGIRAVLDWEIAHRGDPMEDLGWLCVKTWRFGGPAPVGGFGRREDLFEAYERAGGGRVDPERVRFWEAFGSVKWAIMCLMKGESYRRGGERTVEALAIGRRTEEPVHDFLRLVYG